MSTRMVRFALAAAVILVVLGGATFWPFGHGGKDQWWLTPSAAWGQELLTTLSTVQAVTCRERSILVKSDGTQVPCDTWDIFYVSRDSYRRDIYDGDVLREIQLYVPDGSDRTIHYYIRYDLGCYGSTKGEGSFGVYDPNERMRFYTGLVDKADKFLGEETIDGHPCVGFEIRASQYGNNPETWIDRIWFDTQTRLPVRIEEAGRPVTGRPTETFTTIKDQFNFAPLLPADTFVPQPPPAGFINAHPDDLPRQ